MVSPAAVREVVESIVIAFVLAFLFRTFEAEAFVIPTGSMAPTLMGRHKDLTCANCGFPFQASASDEVNNDTNTLNGKHVISCTCPNCRFTMDLTEANAQGQAYRSYKGDRILVGKFPYQFGDPERWDVAVFKFPGGAKTNYIKRIVGLPGEWLRISGGDIFVQPAKEDARARSPDQWQIARKPPRKIRATLRTVYDNNYVLPWMVEAGWPPRWRPVAEGPGNWVTSADYRSFQADGSAQGEVWIGYRHFVPSFSLWQDLKRGPLPAGYQPKEELISDFTAYNTEKTDDMSYGLLEPGYHQLGLHWVGDLAVEADVHVASESGAVILELVEGGRRFQCRIDVVTGEAALSIDGLESYRPKASTSVRGQGTYHLLFANVDDQLTLWANGDAVEFDTQTTYGRLGNTLPTRADLEPVRIGSHGAKLRVEALKVHRDTYYIAAKSERGSGGFGGPITDYQWDAAMRYHWTSPEDNFRELKEAMSDPERYRAFAEHRRSVQFELKADQFLVLGDNSAESKDSRLWGSEHKPNGGYLAHFVSRELLIGKALVIYWPHSLDRIPYLDIPIRFFPNFKRMWIVR
jgi:signal peptidase I